MGRQLDETIGTANVGKLLSNAMGIILPSFIAFVFGKVKGGLKWLQLIFVIPIFVLHIILATRFKLLFAFIPYCIISGLINVSNPTKKTNIMLIILIVASSMISSIMKDNRYMSVSELAMDDYIVDEYSNSRWSVKLGTKLSPEGIIQVMKYADDYFENHDLRYGIESSNILYRWIPRKIWPNKPTTLDHWLIRYYENVPDTHSTSSGFIGVFRADFGWLAALLFAFLIGMMIARINVYMNRMCTDNTSSIEYVMAVAMIPFVFFFVRSPITSAYTLLFEYFVYVTVRVLTTNKKYNH
jgi:oligosaccharide repeat unit polymerase